MLSLTSIQCAVDLYNMRVTFRQNDNISQYLLHLIGPADYQRTNEYIITDKVPRNHSIPRTMDLNLTSTVQSPTWPTLNSIPFSLTVIFANKL